MDIIIVSCVVILVLYVQAFCMGLFEVAEELCRPGASPGRVEARAELARR